MSNGLVAIVLGIGGIIIYQVADLLAGHWRKHRAAEFAATLKQQMIDRGMTADEIVRVLAAEADAGKAAEAGGGLTGALIDGGYEATAVADVTAAVDAAPAGLRERLRADVARLVEGGYEADDILAFIARRVDAAAAA